MKLISPPARYLIGAIVALLIVFTVFAEQIDGWLGSSWANAAAEPCCTVSGLTGDHRLSQGNI